MFDKLGQFASLIKNLPRMREEMDKLQAQLAQVIAEGDAGGGMVKVKVNGRLEVIKCTLSDEVLKANDRELLEDLIAGAVNQALQKAKEAAAAEGLKVAGGLGLPPGFNPG